MAYYTALINAWNSTVQPPAGVTGGALTSTMLTAAKLAIVDAWTVTGSIPTILPVSGAQIANQIVWSEFNALSSAQQTNLLALLAIPGSLTGGSAEVALLLDGMVLAMFSSTSTTRANFTALAQGAVSPWWQQMGYTSPISQGDLDAAGGLA